MVQLWTRIRLVQMGWLLLRDWCGDRRLFTVLVSKMILRVVLARVVLFRSSSRTAGHCWRDGSGDWRGWHGGNWQMVSGGAETVLSGGIGDCSTLTGWVYVAVAAFAVALIVRFFFEVDAVFLFVGGAELTVYR